MSKEIIKIFDTDAKRWGQSPGASMNIEEKIQIAIQLEKLGVDIIEAGFAASSHGDFDAISKISQRITDSTVCSFGKSIGTGYRVGGKIDIESKKA